MSRVVGYLLGTLLLTGCGVGVPIGMSGPLSGISIVRTWKDLLEQAPVEVGEGVKVHFGIEKRTSPALSGVLIYCLAEGFSEWTEGHWKDRLGPLRVAVAVGDVNEPQLSEAMPLPKLRGDKNAVLLFVYALHLERPVNHRVALFTDEGRRIAETTVRGTSEFFHPWLTFGGESGLEIDQAMDGSITQVIDTSALPAWRDTPVFRGTREGLNGHSSERLPTLVPETLDAGFHIRIQEGRLILASDADLTVLCPYEYLLTKWWVNGKPYVPLVDMGGYMAVHNGALSELRTMDLRLLLKPADIGAKSGDRIDLQVLYCNEGWVWVTNDLELRWPSGGGDYDRPPLLRLSNRASFVIP